VLRLQSALKPYLRQFAYASCTLFGRDRMGVFFRAADDYPATPELLAGIEALFGIAGETVLRYDDKRRGNARHILVQDGTLQALSLAGDVAAERWLREYLETEQPVAALGRLLLQPSAVAPQGFKSRGRIVCNCFNVAEAEINDALEELDGPAEARLAALQGRLKCGTNCGSCVPELKKIITIHSVAVVAPA
jgi:assimilatory nitrate reductase catalytic subunit